MAAIDDADDVGFSSLSLVDNNPSIPVVDGIDSVLDTDMPFVNRHEELWQLFRVNADNLVKISQHEEDHIDNFRRYHLLFCVQYFDAGKTTLGKEFPRKITNDQDVKETFATKLQEKNNVHLESEWKIIQEQGIRRVFIDVRAEPNMILKAAKLASGDKSIDIRNSPEEAADYLIKFATDNGPTLFHFDEVGAKEQHNLKELRELAVAVWAQMHAIKREQGADAMPRVYFLVTGKSTEPFQEVDTGSHESPCGSHFLVLDMLSAEHVGDEENKHDDDSFAAFGDETEMEVVVRAIAEERKYSQNRMDGHIQKLIDLEIDTVGDLRSISVERIEKLGMPPVVTEYLQRVKKGQ